MNNDNTYLASSLGYLSLIYREVGSKLSWAVVAPWLIVEPYCIISPDRRRCTYVRKVGSVCMCVYVY